MRAQVYQREFGSTCSLASQDLESLRGQQGDFCLCFGWSWVRRTNAARVVYIQLLFFDSYPTVWIKPLITAIFTASCFYSWKEEEEGVGEGGGNGGVCDWVSPPLCCSAHDKPLLFYQDLPSLACLLQIAALFTLCSATLSPARPSSNTLAYI